MLAVIIFVVLGLIGVAYAVAVMRAQQDLTMGIALGLLFAGMAVRSSNRVISDVLLGVGAVIAGLKLWLS